MSEINHPAHYNTSAYEVIDVIEDWELGFHLGNAVKYIARAPHKGKPIEDLRKALWYLDRYIEKFGVNGLAAHTAQLDPVLIADAWELGVPLAYVIENIANVEALDAARVFLADTITHREQAS